MVWVSVVIILINFFSHQDFTTTTIIYNCFEKRLKKFLEVLRHDHQDEIVLPASVHNESSSLIQVKVGKLLSMLLTLLMTPCFASTVILRDLLKILNPLYYALEDEINLSKVTGLELDSKEFFNLRNLIFKIFGVLCDYEFSLCALSNNTYK